MKVLSSEEREESILNAGAQLAAKYGAVNVTRRMVASKLKISDGLVSHYMGGTAEAQAAYKKRMKKLKLVEPAKDKIEALGVKLRAKGPREVKSTRKRSIREVKAIKRNVAAKKVLIAKKPKTLNGKKVTMVIVDEATHKIGLGTQAEKLKKLVNNRSIGKSVAPNVKALYQATNAAISGVGQEKPKRVRPSRAKPKPPENKVIPAAPENKAARLPKAPPPGLDATA